MLLCLITPLHNGIQSRVGVRFSSLFLFTLKYGVLGKVESKSDLVRDVSSPFLGANTIGFQSFPTPEGLTDASCESARGFSKLCWRVFHYTRDPTVCLMEASTRGTV